MPRVFLISLTLLLLWDTSYGQTPRIDSLKQVLKTEVDEVKALHIRMDLAWEMMHIDLDVSFKSMKELEGACKQIGGEKERAMITNMLGVIYEVKEDYEVSKKHFSEALGIFNKIKDRSGSSTVLLNLGNISAHTGNFSKALEYYYAHAQIIEELGLVDPLILSYTNIAGVYVQQEKYIEALSFYNKALALTKKENPNDVTGAIYNGFANCYLEQKKYGDAKKNYELSLKKCLNIDLQLVAYNYNGMARMHIALGELSEGATYIVKAIETGKDAKYPDALKESYTLLFTLYEKLHIITDEDWLKMNSQDDSAMRNAMERVLKQVETALDIAEREEALAEQELEDTNHFLIASIAANMLLLLLFFVKKKLTV